MLKKERKLDDAIEDLAYRVNGATLEVHKELGPGLLEILYENALCLELSRRSIRYERQKEYEVNYKGMSIGTHILDIVIEDKIVLELKAVEKFSSVHQAQILSYLKISNKRLAFLINFNTRFLKEGIKRFVL